MTELVGLYGASGFGREVLPLLRRQERESDLVFIDDGSSETQMNGVPVLDWDGFMARSVDKRSVCIAIADSRMREKLADRCSENGIGFVDVHADNVVIMDDVEIGAGSILCPFVTLTSGIRIGKQFQANIYSYVAHDCVIGDFVTFAPGVKCNGNVTIEDHAYIGTGAILRQGQPGKPLVIGKGAIVGMGAVVTKDVPPGVTVIGNPARPLER